MYSVADTTPAARLASILKYAGVDDVRILDGNLKAWDAAGYDYIPKAGRIKGAIYGYGGKNAYDMSDYRNPDNTMVSYTFMKSRWLDQGIKPENTII